VGRNEDLAKLDSMIKDAESRVKTVSANLESLDKEIYLLSSLEKNLKENVNELKKKKVVAVAQEFKKAKEDLKKTQVRMGMLRNDREHYVKVIKDMEAFLVHTRREIEKMRRNAEDNVLQFKRGNKNG
jgi:chromosome segregation ATPase